jgi:DNA-binding response OmpR family regulator
MRLLLVEDNRALAESVAKLFRGKGYAVDAVETGDDARTALQTQPYDLVILDLGLPDVDGLEVLRRMRRAKSRVPVLVLTARAGALIRRGVGGGSAVISHGPLALDTNGRFATLDGVPLELPRRELCLLELLLLRAGQVVEKQTLLEKLFSYDEEAGVNAIEIYVHRLRKKLEPSGIHVRTIRGLGYLLENP